MPARLLDAFPDGRDPDLAWRAPGRVNLVGEHTDYNQGWVLPVALDLDTHLAGRRADHVLRLRSLDEPGDVTVDLRTGEGPEKGWGRYATGVVRALLDESLEVSGFEGIVASQVPAGAGLSSSAALELVLALSLVPEGIEAVDLAAICRRAENVYVGVQCGIMDQLASAAGRQDQALLIDCRSEEIELVPMPQQLSIVVMDSGLRHQHSSGAYNEWREQCAAAAAALGLASLRDADLDDLARLDDAILVRRARHVITENRRVLDAAEALQAGETDLLGVALFESHRSMAEDFAISTPEMDELVSVASETAGVVGARLTGGGFGGCTVNVVATEAAAEVAAEIAGRYRHATGREADHWISRPSAGASQMRGG